MAPNRMLPLTPILARPFKFLLASNFFLRGVALLYFPNSESPFPFNSRERATVLSFLVTAAGVFLRAAVDVLFTLWPF